LSGNIISEYTLFSGQRIARRDVSSGNIYYIFSDRLGSYRTLTDSTGNVKGESDYYAFGAERMISSTVTDNFRFAGMEWDSEDGLNHTLYRQYTPAQCRWESTDPVRGCVMHPQGQNLYAYVRDNPTNFTDPSGDIAAACDPITDPDCCDPPESPFCFPIPIPPPPPPNVSVSSQSSTELRTYRLASLRFIPIPVVGELSGSCKYVACDQRPSGDLQSNCNSVSLGMLWLGLRGQRCRAGFTANVVASSVTVTVWGYSYTQGICTIDYLGAGFKWLDKDPCPVSTARPVPMQ